MDRLQYEFGVFTLFPESEQLFAGRVEVRLGHRAMRILSLLVQRDGTIVKHSELVGYAWPETVVEENNLRVQMTAIRQALRQFEPEATYIRNVAGRGYRFFREQNDEPDSLVNVPTRENRRELKGSSVKARQLLSAAAMNKCHTRGNISAVREDKIGRACRQFILAGTLPVDRRGLHQMRLRLATYAGVRQTAMLSLLLHRLSETVAARPRRLQTTIVHDVTQWSPYESSSRQRKFVQTIAVDFAIGSGE
ncbi:winged helix-turn-helix domain-containing protein [Paraburkholderia sp. BL25I1N1]|uniref:winged helix-turn-helix domain-containing protein n=1 Tax=Paraburkholderia sp. BL25I1N1 TaxID=1938804 RepID=UPI000D07F6E3|nr:winged helix-turn-helix domain-containing protein [Paraburkholderia sp. BL25I1N1]PRY05988.1 DNA-binding winged helix-turn-helix (wHTH) protein [Paraburkholderia sp. BL25I1N1]